MRASDAVHSPSHRRIARLFASLLLLWTAADVCDYGLCPHHRDRLGGYARTAFRAGETEERPDVAGADDCFCCSHVVDVRTPFRIALTYQVAWTVLGDPHTRPDVPSVPLYHPPLA
jgi:hypothetical protein